MEVKICKNCRRLFNYIYGPELCPNCVKLLPNVDKDETNKLLTARLRPLVIEDELKFQAVKEYIMKNPRASIIQIADDNDVTPAQLLKWIREDRLEFSDDSEYAWLTCEKCGVKIRSGRLCNRCKAGL